ncbi:MAG: DUF4129 domain-containing protein [Myxococcota bacterium]
MSALVAWFMVLSTPPPSCEAPAQRAASWSTLATGNREELVASISAAEEEVGPVLLLEDESALPLPKLADVAGRRLLHACALLAAPSEPAIEPARQRLSQILDRPEFARARMRNTNVLQRMFLWLQSWLSKLFETQGAATFSNWARAAVLGAAFAAVGVAGFRLARTRRRRKEPSMSPALGERLPLENPVTHLSNARRLLEPDPREAIREGLFALLSSLERRRLARPDRVKTNRELASELPTRGAPPELTEAVGGLVGWYDRAFYSLEPVVPLEARHFVEEVEQLIGVTP